MIEGAPSPRTVAAWLVLGMIAIERVPWWAAQWLADGADGEALRELAGLNGQDSYAIRDRLPLALAEMRVALPATDVAAAEEAFWHLAELFQSGHASERWIAQKVDEIITRADYNSEILDLPLRHLYGVEDAWIGGWGPSIDELKATVRAKCDEQLDSALVRNDGCGEPMLRRIDLSNLDLDHAACLIARCTPAWLSRGLTIDPITWMDNGTGWPAPLLADRNQAIRPKSLGLRLRGQDSEAEVVLYAGGWADLDYARPGSDEVISEYIELETAEEFGPVLDRITDLLTNAAPVDNSDRSGA